MTAVRARPGQLLACVIGITLASAVAVVTLVDRSGDARRASASPTASPSATPARPGSLRVAALGDSLTRHDDRPEAGRLNNSWFARLLRTKAGYVYAYNASVDGSSTRQMRERLDSDVLSREPDLVLVLGGINDIASRVATEQILANLRDIVVRVTNSGARAVVGTVPPWDGVVQARGDAGADAVIELNTGIRRLAAERAITVIDFYAATAGPDGRWLPGTSRDGLHPNEVGVSLMVDAAVRALAR